MNLTTLPATFNNAAVKNDDAGRPSLTDLWKAAGSDAQRTPAKWQETEAARGFIAAVQRILNIVSGDIIQSKRGRTGGTFAHPQVALEYAQYLNPDLAVAVNSLYFQRVEEEKNPDLIIDRAVKTYERRGFTPERIAARLNGKATRHILTSTLKQHGVSGVGFRDCTRATYFPLFGGGTETIRQAYNIPAKANVRDGLPLLQLRSIEFAEALSADTIDKNGAYGNDACVSECNRAAQSVAAMVKAHRAGASS